MKGCDLTKIKNKKRIWKLLKLFMKMDIIQLGRI